MKKTNGLILVAAALIGSVISVTGCNSSFKPSQKVLDAVKDAETLSHDELFKKAAEELGTTGQIKIAGTTSRGGKDAVKNAFIAELQKYNSGITAPIAYDTYVDGKIYSILQEEITSGKTDGYTGTITQDGYQLAKKGIDTGYYVNYIPKTWKDATDTDVDANGDPFTLQYNFKTWMYNNKDNTPMVTVKDADGNVTKTIDKIDNVWDVTHSGMKRKIDTMNPYNENVNMDWMIQLTSDDNVALLKEAYLDSTNDSDVDVENYSQYGDKKYAYAFIDKFINNSVFYDDDGEAMTHLASTPGNVGWIVYSKILKVKESASISKENIIVAALGTDNTDGATIVQSNIKGFGGFMYKHYLQIMPNAQYPYATCAYFELISTNATAYKVWGDDVGDYPSMPSINQDRTKGGQNVAKADGTTVNMACLNDPNSAWWIGNAKAVVETPSFIGANYDSVIDLIESSCAHKN